MIKKFKLEKVHYMPVNLDPGILYVSSAFGAAAHLCACGCGSVVRTPLNRWSLTETMDGPSLYPSIGNWQEPCKSHYWIEHGEVKWAKIWTSKQIENGRRHEAERLNKRYHELNKKHFIKLNHLWHWLTGLF
jgi:hypothetical protein